VFLKYSFIEAHTVTVLLHCSHGLFSLSETCTVPSCSPCEAKEHATLVVTGGMCSLCPALTYH